MYYDLIPRDVLNEVCGALTEAKKTLGNDEFDKETRLWIDRAYQSIQRNRRQCNVKPEEE